MKLNKTFGRIATTLVATAMLASVTAVPAFAADGAIGENGYYDDVAIDAFTFTKELEMPIGVEKPTVTFNFTLSPAAPAEGEIAEDESTPANTADVQEGKGSITATAEFDSASTYTNVPVTTGTPTTQKASETVRVDISSFISSTGITEPGVYKYVLEETSLTATGVAESDFTLSDMDRTVYLYVERIDNVCVVTGVELYNGEIELVGEGVDATLSDPAKTDSILNYYMLSGDPDDPSTPPTVIANDLTIEKAVKGSMGNMSEEFTFSFTVNSNTENKAFSYVVTKDGEQQTSQTVTEGTQVPNILLAHGDTIKITGLTGTDSVTVSETDNGEGYTTSYLVTSGSTQNGTTAENVGLATSAGNPVSTNITFTNTREAVSPTGLIMDIAPYVLLVVVAAAGCFVFLRKRRED